MILPKKAKGIKHAYHLYPVRTNTALFYEESVSLPIYPDLSYKDQKYVTQSIKEIIKL